MNHVVLLVATILGASDPTTLQVKREAVFEFAQKPVVTREGGA